MEHAARRSATVDFRGKSAASDADARRKDAGLSVPGTPRLAACFTKCQIRRVDIRVGHRNRILQPLTDRRQACGAKLRATHLACEIPARRPAATDLSRTAAMNHLYYGDNLSVLRDRKAFPDECVDLIYLDLARPPTNPRYSHPPPRPFNSKRDYNLLFKSPKGHSSEAQIEAFEDRGGGRDSWMLVGGRDWHWNQQAEREFDDLLHQPKTDVAEMMKALRGFLGENDRGGGRE